MTTSTNITTSTDYVVDFWDVTEFPNKEALPPAPMYWDETPWNPFVNSATIYMIVGEHLVDNSYFNQEMSQDPALYCVEVYTLFNVQCVAMSQHLYETLSPLWPGEKIIFISEEVAMYGKQFFADYRAAAKVWVSNTVDTMPPGLASPSDNLPEGMKVPVELTDEVVAKIVEFMQLFAKMIITDEFERRLLSYMPGGVVEQTSWQIQKDEARLWLSGNATPGETDFIDYLAESHNRDKTDLANAIMRKARQYEQGLADILVSEQKLLSQFMSCTTVWDLNILYEQYFGLQMPAKQAQSMGLTEGPDSLQRTTQVPHGFQF
jgi:hypothetical protein